MQKEYQLSGSEANIFTQLNLGLLKILGLLLDIVKKEKYAFRLH